MKKTPLLSVEQKTWMLITNMMDLLDEPIMQFNTFNTFQLVNFIHVLRVIWMLFQLNISLLWLWNNLNWQKHLKHFELKKAHEYLHDLITSLIPFPITCLSSINHFLILFSPQSFHRLSFYSHFNDGILILQFQSS